jgi:hypothetical protein
MSVFEYLGVLLSVVMGLGLTHLLTGLSKTIHHRDTLRIYWVHLVWVFNVALYIVAIWWGLFWWSGQSSWSFLQFLFILLYAVVLFLLASLLYPWDVAADQDFEEHFWRTRPWFFAILAIAWMIDVPETVLKGQEGLRAMPAEYAVFAATQVTLAIIGASTSNRRFHSVYAVLWPVITVGYLTLTTLAQIAG